MTWLTWLALAAIVAAFAGVTGIKPKGTRHIAGSRMMGAARIVLLVLIVVFAWMAYRAHSGV